MDVLDFLEENIPENFEFRLSEILPLMKQDGLLGKNFEDIDFLYDSCAIALAELFFMFKDNGKYDFPIVFHEEEDSYGTLSDIKSFTADKNSLEYLWKCLTDIKDEVPDTNGRREIVDLWRKSDEWENWQNNLNGLIERIKKEIE